MKKTQDKLWRYTALYIVINSGIALAISVAVALIHHLSNSGQESSSGGVIVPVIAAIISAYFVHLIYYKKNGEVLSKKQNNQLIIRCSIGMFLVQVLLGVIFLIVIVALTSFQMLFVLNEVYKLQYIVPIAAIISLIIYSLIILSGFKVSRYKMLKLKQNKVEL